MNTPVPDIRLVVFGPLTADAAALATAKAKRVVAQVTAGQQPDDVPPAVVQWDVLQRTPEGWRPGPRLVWLPPLNPAQEEAVTDAARTCVAVVAGAVGSLKKALSGITSRPPEEGWRRHGLVILAALLLDLSIGERLRTVGLVGKVRPGWRLWAVPQAPGVIPFGARCIHDEASGVGAGVLWYGNLPTLQLPAPGDLSAFVAIRAGEAARAESLLRLRYLGWLKGLQPTTLVLAAGTPLPELLEHIAADAVEQAYRPLLDGAASRWPCFDERRLLLGRMTMELALHAMINADVVAAPTEESARYWVWEGRRWQLATETRGG